MFKKKTIRDIDVNGKIVLVRVDYNVPLKDGKVASNIRILASIPTIKYLVENGAKRIILMSHLGRPDGITPELSLRPVVNVLEKALFDEGVRTKDGMVPVVEFVPAVSGDDVKASVGLGMDGDIVLLENLRFWKEEKANSEGFMKAIVESTGAEVFVQDGFAVIHRAHASTSAITKLLPSVSGLLVEKEVSTLSSAILNPEHPVLVIIGGAKVDDKEPLIQKFLPIADKIAVGGKIAADGYKAEDSTRDPELAKKIYVADDFATDEKGAKLDIGPNSTAKIAELVRDAKTIIWNGVVGLTEQEPFDTASKNIAAEIGSKKDATTIICGGDTTGFVQKLVDENPDLKYSLISTGGGASLELLSGLELPGLEALEDK